MCDIPVWPPLLQTGVVVTTTTATHGTPLIGSQLNMLCYDATKSHMEHI